MRSFGVELSPETVALLIERKLPKYVQCLEAGFENSRLPFPVVKRLVVEYVRLGYVGEITFYRDCHDNSRYSNSARADFKLSRWVGAAIDEPESGRQPARVKLSCFEKFGGTPASYQPITTACGDSGLVSYAP